MSNYFEELMKTVKDNKCNITYKNIILKAQPQNVIVNKFVSSQKIKDIYENYAVFKLNWEWKQYRGFIHFVASSQLENEHKKLIDTMKECYDFKQDELNIRNDIENWYPIFKFPNGDAFCLDIRTGKIVFYEHEIYDTGINLHGTVIALSVDDLYEKWSQCAFADIYDWSEGVNEAGIDINSDIYGELIHMKAFKL